MRRDERRCRHLWPSPHLRYLATLVMRGRETRRGRQEEGIVDIVQQCRLWLLRRQVDEGGRGRRGDDGYRSHVGALLPSAGKAADTVASVAGGKSIVVLTRRDVDKVQGTRGSRWGCTR
jgi:hypothetical protein